MRIYDVLVNDVNHQKLTHIATVKLQSHRIVGFLDRTIGCD